MIMRGAHPPARQPASPPKYKRSTIHRHRPAQVENNVFFWTRKKNQKLTFHLPNYLWIKMDLVIVQIE